MVFVNSKKFACESCIKGHRSSACHHTDRPLFEIKKKGRPVSQCEKCRELRQSKKLHSKCTCNPKDHSNSRGLPLTSGAGSKSRRFIPIAPALPNGLKDVLEASKISHSLPADARQRVDSLLNPCPCKSLWKCECRSSSALKSQPEKSLNTLARAAAMCHRRSSSPLHISTTDVSHPKRQSSRSNSPSASCHKRSKPGEPGPGSHVAGPDLPPIFYGESRHSLAPASVSVPVFSVMPPMSTITSLAGSGCTCGLNCACPGCVEHRGVEHASKERPNCADGCGTCIDHAGGIALPGQDTSSMNSNSIIDRFFARAAALPSPPASRSSVSGTQLDPMNVTVYPHSAMETEKHGAAFGLVTLPKLECCGGQCGCPGGRCGCGQTCNGCCDREPDRRETGSPEAVQMAPPKPAAPAVRSCCAGRTAVSVA